MEDIRIPIYAAEPYQEASTFSPETLSINNIFVFQSQGKDDSSVPSRDALAAFYKDMERKESEERKPSKHKSNSGMSIWSRKSLKRSATAHPAPPPPPAPKPHPPTTDIDPHDEKRRGEEERDKETNALMSDQSHQLNSPRSIIPNSKELPAWYNKDAWDSVPLPSFKLRYVIHNPVGPRWYKNHHLVPPSETTPAARPPSFFSPSFPPMASSASQERSEDATRLAGPSRTPSNSPLPTPNSSQTRVIDKPRSRKTSTTAHDTVDLLDVTDPWGTNWHHHSPYDIGLSNGQISVDVQDAMHTRSRLSSLTAHGRSKTVIPSPLSQSTSAIHLPQSTDTGAHIPRKLSKRRAPTIANIFGGQSQNAGRNAVSLPTTPMETRPPPGDLPQRMSVAPSNMYSMSLAPSSTSPKKEKRGSMLGRLVKKFSILRKHHPDQGRAERQDDWHHVSTDSVLGNNAARHSFIPERQPSPEKPPFDAVKRVPPPTIDEPTVIDEAPKNSKEADRTSCISLEAPFSIGRLTVANPDSPGSGETTPAQGQLPLPPDKRDIHVNSEFDRPPSPTYSPMLKYSEETLPVLPQKAAPIPAPPLKEHSYETSPLSSSIRPPSVDLHDPSSAQKASTSSPNLAPSVISRKSRVSVNGALPGPSAENSSHLGSQQAKASTSHASETFHASQESKHARPTSLASSVPFPGESLAQRIKSLSTYDNPRLSTVSMLANPPTPYSHDITMPGTPGQPPPPLPSRTSADVTSLSAKNRQTETFRLVRSPSGNVYASNETFVAAGHQWEVVEARDKGKSKLPSSSKDQPARDRDSRTQDSFKDRDSKDRDSKDRDSKHRSSRDHESGHRREKKRESKTNPKPESDSRHRHRTHRETKSGERSTSSTKPTVQETSSAAHDAVRSHRLKDDKERRSEGKKRESASAHVNDKSQHLPSVPTTNATSRPLGRHPSLSARPTSQLPSTDEMNAMRAREAWDMERLWKARSMQGDEINKYTTMPSIPSNQNSPLIGSDISSTGAVYGSSHTAFVASTPFQAPSIYHSMPAAPPPIIYSSPTSMPAVTAQLRSTQKLTSTGKRPHRTSHSRPYSDSAASDQTVYTASSVLRAPNTIPEPRPSNPLPEPPRESTYEIPADSRNSEYWTKYVGVTTSH
ncbi:hypothetical protein H0H81_007476 [Sphagnurus paluster]|uniref:Uncharacterized protein n=1 Tax=Sphagnurus paluster TaxID=117069 RepID=A0A9P7KNC6_9AGAR|nr:hypothetical protein H0H81_007476 [Sphagnurus paluster]